MPIGFDIYLKDMTEEMDDIFPARPTVCFAVIKHGGCVLVRNIDDKLISLEGLSQLMIVSMAI